MNLNFKPVEAEDLEKLNPFFCKRPNKTCDSVFLDSFIWREYYNVRYAVSDNKAIFMADGFRWKNRFCNADL